MYTFPGFRLLLICSVLLVVCAPVHSNCQHPRPLTQFDLNGDGIADIVSAVPCHETGDPTPGVVTITDGASGNILFNFIGKSNGDMLGWSIAYVGDLNFDGLQDLIVGAPGAGEAYIILGSFEEFCVRDIAIADVNMTLVDPGTTNWHFGVEVAPLYDYDGDGVEDVRVAAKYFNRDGLESTLVYIFCGQTGGALARVESRGARDRMEAQVGDATGEAHVDLDDLSVVLHNYGSSGNLTAHDGDLNGDGSVDAWDYHLAVTHLGKRFYDNTGDNPPPDFECTAEQGCWSYAMERGEEWYCVTGENCGEVVAVFIGGGGPGSINSCQQQYNDCVDNNQYVSDALDLFFARCGGSEFTVAITCGPCKGYPPTTKGYFKVHKCGDGCHGEIRICSGVTGAEFCVTLAHELIHASQACNYGVCDDCTEFERDWYDKHHRMCMEFEAYRLSGECNSPPPDDCCQRACRSAKKLWNNCASACEACCKSGALSCCSGGRNVCKDAGQNPCGGN